MWHACTSTLDADGMQKCTLGPGRNDGGIPAPYSPFGVSGPAVPFTRFFETLNLPNATDQQSTGTPADHGLPASSSTPVTPTPFLLLNVTIYCTCANGALFGDCASSSQQTPFLTTSVSGNATGCVVADTKASCDAHTNDENRTYCNSSSTPPWPAVRTEETPCAANGPDVDEPYQMVNDVRVWCNGSIAVASGPVIDVGHAPQWRQLYLPILCCEQEGGGFLARCPVSCCGVCVRATPSPSPLSQTTSATSTTTAVPASTISSDNNLARRRVIAIVAGMISFVVIIGIVAGANAKRRRSSQSSDSNASSDDVNLIRNTAFNLSELNDRDDCDARDEYEYEDETEDLDFVPDGRAKLQRSPSPLESKRDSPQYDSPVDSDMLQPAKRAKGVTNKRSPAPRSGTQNVPHARGTFGTPAMLSETAFGTGPVQMTPQLHLGTGHTMMPIAMSGHPVMIAGGPMMVPTSMGYPHQAANVGMPMGPQVSMQSSMAGPTAAGYQYYAQIFAAQQQQQQQQHAAAMYYAQLGAHSQQHRGAQHHHGAPPIGLMGQMLQPAASVGVGQPGMPGTLSGVDSVGTPGVGRVFSGRHTTPARAGGGLSGAKTKAAKAPKPKEIAGVSVEEWGTQLQESCKTAFSRLSLKTDPRIQTDILNRIHAGAAVDKDAERTQCYLVERGNLNSKSPFQIPVAGVRILAQKSIYAAYNNLAATDMGNWQVHQRCKHNDGTWWCFEPAHLEKCDRDHMAPKLPKHAIPRSADAVYLARSRQARHTPMASSPADSPAGEYQAPELYAMASSSMQPRGMNGMANVPMMMMMPGSSVGRMPIGHASQMQPPRQPDPRQMRLQADGGPSNGLGATSAAAAAAAARAKSDMEDREDQARSTLAAMAFRTV